MPESEIQARRKAFLDRGLTVDGRGDAKVNSLQFTVNGNSNDNVQNNRLSGNHGSGELGEASEKNLIAFDLFVQSAGLEGMAIDTVGSRHSSLLAIMSAGASRVMSEEELMKVVRTKMPSYYQEDDCHQLIHDFYAKYADSCKPMSRDVIRVNALAEQKANEVKSEERRVKNSDAFSPQEKQQIDSILRTNMPGETDSMYMIIPVLSEKGLWEMKGDAMGGPYAMRRIRLRKTGDEIIIIGFVYAPEMKKKILIKQLEAAISTIK